MTGFINNIRETCSLWNYLQHTAKPIVLYGMGDGAEKIIRYLTDYGKSPDGIFASDDFVRGQKFLDYTVKRYADFVEEYGDFIVLVAFGTQNPDVIANILRIKGEQETYAPNVPLFGEGLFDYDFVLKYEAELSEVYNNLADEKSREVFLNICDYSISGKIDYLMDSVCEKAEVWRLLDFSRKEVYLDLGAYNGDTVKEFAEIVEGGYKQILAVEPDSKNFAKLLRNTQSYSDVRGINCGIWQEKAELFFSSKAGRNSALSTEGKRSVRCLSVDDIQREYAESGISYIKMDVEGVEKQALSGAVQTIKVFKPKMLVSAYHRNEDIFQLPLQIWRLNPEYKIYFRHHMYIPGWENNYYCI
ncbi:MAG: FkbM family methyltransferase [Bacillota bacterium]